MGSVSSRVGGRFQWRCFLLLRFLMRDSPWFKTELVLCTLVTPLRYLLPCVLSHYSLLLVLVFCEGFFLSFLFFFFSFFLSFLLACIPPGYIYRDVVAHPQGSDSTRDDPIPLCVAPPAKASPRYPAPASIIGPITAQLFSAK